MKLAVFGIATNIGGRDRYRDYTRVHKLLSNYEGVECIISGGGKGVEQMALRYAQEKDLDKEVVPPNIEGSSNVGEAFRLRNSIILKKCDLAIIITDVVRSVYDDLITSAIHSDVPITIYKASA